MYRENCPEDLEAYQMTHSPIPEYLRPSFCQMFLRQTNFYLGIYIFYLPFSSACDDLDNRTERTKPRSRSVSKRFSVQTARGKSRSAINLEKRSLEFFFFFLFSFFILLSPYCEEIRRPVEDDHSLLRFSLLNRGDHALVRRALVIVALLLLLCISRRRARKEIRRRTDVHTLVPADTAPRSPWTRASYTREEEIGRHRDGGGPNGSHRLPCERASK